MDLKFILLCYFIGQLCYMALKAQAVASSTVNGFPRGWRGVPAYFGHYVVILVVRAIFNFITLMLVMGGGATFSANFIPAIFATNPIVLRCFAYVVGFAMDGAVEKLQDLVPILKGLIPPPPPPPQSNGKADGVSA